MIPVSDGYISKGEWAWIITPLDGLVYRELTYINGDMVSFGGYLYDIENIKKLGFIDKKKAEIAHKLGRN
jgi:hypothetical protein